MACNHAGGNSIKYDESENVHVCTTCGLQIVDYAECDKRASVGSETEKDAGARQTQIGALHTNVALWRMLASPTPSGPTWTQASQLATPPGAARSASQSGRGPPPASLSLLDQVCANHHIAGCIEEEAKFLLSTVSFHSCRNRFSTRDEVLAGYALYRAALQHNAGRTMSDIAHMFGISEPSLWRVDGKFAYSRLKLLPSSQIWRARMLLQLSFREGEKVAAIADRVSCVHLHAPPTILAACLYIYCNALPEANQVPMRVCARVCLASAASAIRLVRKLESCDKQTVLDLSKPIE
jgi:transcription initiation factor TFIIIB Brf1 subunit/transcription initiation factor TFIIB